MSFMMPQSAMMPMPMGGPMMPAGGGMDPVGAPGAILDADFSVLVKDAMARVGPQPPPWYVPSSRPSNPRDIIAEAHDQQQEHAQRVVNQALMEMRLGREISSIFSADELYVKHKEIEPQLSPLLIRMFNAIVNFISGQNIQFSSRARGLVNREERSAIESHLDEAWRAASAQAYRQGEGLLISTLTADAMAGMVALYHAPDPGVPLSGQRCQRVDPKCVFPIFGRDGADRVYTVYDAAYPEVMRDFSDGPRGPSTKAIQAIARKGGGRGNRQFDMSATNELVGYWDRQHAVITWKGEVIREWTHNLYVCPWQIGVPNWRQAAGVKSQGGFALGGDRPGPLIDVNGISTPYESIAGGSRQLDYARTYEHFLGPWLPVVDKMEKVQTRLAYGIDRAPFGPYVWSRGSANSTEGHPSVENYRGGVTEVQGTGPDAEKFDVLPMNPVGDMFEPWLSMFTMEVQAMIPTPILQGQSVGTQASGNALDVINEMGYDQFSPVVRFMTALLEEWAHRTLTYKKDLPGPFDEDANPYGGFASYGQDQRGYRSKVKLTRDMLERAGCDVECTMARFSLSGMSAAATTAAILDQQLHVGTRPYWISRFGMAANPQQFDDDRMAQDLDDTPGFAESRALEYLHDQLLEAAELEDDFSLNRLRAKAMRVASVQGLNEQMKAKMAGATAEQDAQAAVMPPEEGGVPAAAGGANPMPYLSAPQMARNVGTEGGAPTQAPPLPGQQG